MTEYSLDPLLHDYLEHLGLLHLKDLFVKEQITLYALKHLKVRFSLFPLSILTKFNSNII